MYDVQEGFKGRIGKDRVGKDRGGKGMAGYVSTCRLGYGREDRIE